jgi:hypothetical protein
MEKSMIRKEWGRMKLLPLCLALLGLVCASWLSIGSETTSHDGKVVAIDTVKKEKEKQSSYFFYRNESDNENRNERSQVPQQFAFATPFPTMLMKDSIPAFIYPPGGNWKEFEQEFTKKFREQFHEFFEQNHAQIEKMMEELREQHADAMPFKFQMDRWSAGQMKEMEETFALINPGLPENFEMPPFPNIDEEWMHENALKFQEEAMAMNEVLHLEEHARVMSDMMRNDSELFRVQEEALRFKEWQVEDYQNALIDQLVQDGYLKKGEKLNDLRIMDDEMSVNGKKIKEKDLKKYKELREQHQPRFSSPHRPE